jgi:hypothetical protein
MVSYKTLIVAILLLSLVLITNPEYAHAEKHENFLPPAIHHSSSIGNLPKWERIVNFYAMANLSTPSPEYHEWWRFIRSIKNDTPTDQITKRIRG